jgi:hypothetical protein
MLETIKVVNEAVQELEAVINLFVAERGAMDTGCQSLFRVEEKMKIAQASLLRAKQRATKRHN